MCFGNGIGLAFNGEAVLDELFKPLHGAFLLECTAIPDGTLCIGRTTDAPEMAYGGERVSLDALYDALQARLKACILPVRRSPIRPRRASIPTRTAVKKRRLSSAAA